MNRLARVQTWCGAAALAALPLLYLGGTRESAALTWTGLVILAAAMLVTPAFRFLPKPRSTAEREPGRVAGSNGS